MANITISVTATQQIQIKAALSFLNERQPATDSQVRGWILGQLKEKVRVNEITIVSAVAESTKRDELITDGW